MKINNEYRIEADSHNWVLIQTKLSKKTGKRPKYGNKTYWATLQQVVNKMVTLEVREIDDLKSVADSVDEISKKILEQVTHDLRTGPYRLYKHGEQL